MFGGQQLERQSTNTMPIITLTTDFGTADTFVASMKGVILSIAPNAVIIDNTHAIPKQDVLAGALAIEAVLPYFPPNTIHVAVVDPGVGSSRAAIAVETGSSILLGPDNGLLTLALAHEPAWRATRLTAPAFHRTPVSGTFHGRDIFASVAGHIAEGVAVADLGESITELAGLNVPQPIPRGETLELHVLHVDHFGNVVTDLTAEQLTEWAGDTPIRLLAGFAEINGLSHTYADVPLGAPLAYIGSGGRLEIAIRDGNAAQKLGMAKREKVLMERKYRVR